MMVTPPNNKQHHQTSLKTKKVFYETKKGSVRGHTGRTFLGFAERRFRMKLLLDEWGKWFRTQGSVPNLYREKSNRFRTQGSVPNLSEMMSKWFRTNGFVLNLFTKLKIRFRRQGFVPNLYKKQKKRFRKT